MTAMHANDPRQIAVAQASGPLGANAVTAWLRRKGWHHQLFEHNPTFRAVDEAVGVIQRSAAGHAIR